MRILILDKYYDVFLNSIRSQQSDLKAESYTDLWHKTMSYGFGTANFYSMNLTKLGHVAQEVIINDFDLQLKWAQENSLLLSKILATTPKFPQLQRPIMELVLLRQVEDFKPDVVYVQGTNILTLALLHKIKRITKLLVAQTAAPEAYDKNRLAVFDLIISALPYFVRSFRQLGLSSEYLGIGFEASLLSRKFKAIPKYKSVFIGSYSNNHSQGNQVLEYVAQKTSTEFWGYKTASLALNSPILKKFHGPVWGIDMYNILHNSQISLNRHINIAKQYAVNMRLYEATGMGTMLITDAKKNLDSVFSVGKEVEAYNTKQDLVDKINYYLNHQAKRESIAKAGQKRTLANYTYAIRMQELTTILNKYL